MSEPIAQPPVNFITDEYREMVQWICKDPSIVKHTFDNAKALTIALLIHARDVQDVAAAILTQAMKEAGRTESAANMLHMAIGISSESGEIFDCLKKHIIYQQPLDLENLEEEVGDLCWYVTGACVIGDGAWQYHQHLLKLGRILEKISLLGDFTVESARDKNYLKLVGPGGRYENGYSDKAAKERVDKLSEEA